jgi:hypothetical protein
MQQFAPESNNTRFERFVAIIAKFLGLFFLAMFLSRLA